MSEKVLVTGASGFVGTALCEELVAAGKSVKGVGRAKREGFPAAAVFESIDLASGDLDEALVGDADCVFHLAGQAHGKGGTEAQQLDGFRRANVDVSVNLANLAIAAGVRRFVFVSSIGVHGTRTDGEPISENSAFRPASSYADSKLEAERAIIKLFENSPSSELTIVRPPLVYGVQAPGNFGSLLKLADSPLPLPFGMCSNRRSLISLDGLVEVLVKCASHPAAGDQSFVVADSSVVSTGEIVQSLRAGMGRSARLLPVPPVLMAGALRLLGKQDMYVQLFKDLEIENTKAMKLLGWEPCQNTLLELETIGKRYADTRN